jgi:1-acyl-sn-glycerol-3-phosphate acyltransferase
MTDHAGAQATPGQPEVAPASPHARRDRPGLFDRFMSRNPGKSVGQILLYEFCVFVSRMLVTIAFRFRTWNSHRLPESGAVLMIANHQSHLDPFVLGVASPRRHINYVARATLFKPRAFGALISTLNALPLKQGAPDIAAFRINLEQLQAGRVLLIFPEGTRSPDGAMQDFKRGTWLLIARARCRIVPIAIEGAYDAWPRWRTWPSLWRRRLGVEFGHPIDSETLVAMGEQRGMAYLRQEIERARESVIKRLRCSGVTLTSKAPGGRTDS